KKGNEYKTLIGIKLIPLPYLDLLDFKLALEIYLYFLHKEIISIMHEYNFEINLESSISKYFSNIIFIANTSKEDYVNYLLMTYKKFNYQISLPFIILCFIKIINQSYYKNQNELDCLITLYYF